LQHAVMRIESGDLRFDPHALHQHASQFETAHFKNSMVQVISTALAAQRGAPHA
jgi:hypothetical protein